MLELLDELAHARGSGIRVAIVDSGVEGDHPWVGGRLKASFRVVNDEGGYGVMDSDPIDVYGHGTAVAGQIRRFAPDVDLMSLQILGGNLKTNSNCLLTALRWLTTQKVHLINLSLSTMREELALLMSHAVDDLYAHNVACICARGYHLTGKAYPTNFAGTIGVAWNGGGVREVEGSSFACPLVTGLAARLLSLRPTLTPYELKTLLKAYAERQAQGWWEDWMSEVDNPPTAA